MLLQSTCEIQVVGGIYNNPHQGEVERSHFSSDLRFFTAVVQIMATKQAVDCINSLSLDLSPANIDTSSELNLSFL